LTTLQVPVTLQLRAVQPPPLDFTFHFARFWDLHRIWDGANLYAEAFSSKHSEHLVPHQLSSAFFLIFPGQSGIFFPVRKAGTLPLFSDIL